MRFFFLNLLLWAHLFSAQRSFAWGQRGHQAITQCAIRLLENMGGGAIYPSYLIHSLHVAYISTTPDTVWRSEKVSDSVRKKNGPTHYISLDSLLTDINKIKYQAKMRALFNTKNIFKPLLDVGSAPHRIIQLHDLLKDEFVKLNDAKDKKGVFDRIIVFSGLLSHFVGDLANPMHLTGDFDGWNSGQGGLHAYFEETVVSVFDLHFEGEMCDVAKQNATKTAIKLDGLNEEILEYMWSSFELNPQLTELDRKASLLKSSINKDGLRIPAERKPSAQVKEKYKTMIVDRMAAGSIMLTRIWMHAWEVAGRPTYPEYSSYYFDHTPKFIEPNY